jgi:multiple sugar transport system substrate-binding protein
MGFLAPLDALLDPEFLADFFPAALDLARIAGKLYAVPRNIDVRVLHYRTDLLDAPPANWDELLQVARRLSSPPDFYGFVFPGKGSGLFGTFYELTAMARADLFPEAGRPDIQNAGGAWALGLLSTFLRERLSPPELVDWSYDQVHLCFREGHAAMVGEWPGHYGLLRDAAVSKVAGRFALAPYPPGPAGVSKAYGGAHTFALTRAGAEKPEALALLRFLTAPERQILEARSGSVPVRSSVMQEVLAGATPEAAERWRVLDAVIRQDVLIPPQWVVYPSIEEMTWRTVQAAITGKMEIEQALAEITEKVVSLKNSGQSSVVSRQ